MTATIDYNKQATDFLEKHGLTFRAEYVGPECPPFCTKSEHGGRFRLPCGGVHGGKYRITLSGRGRSVFFDFWNSYADEYGPGDTIYLKATKLPSLNRLFAEEWTKDTPLIKRRHRPIIVSSAGGVKTLTEIVAKPPTAYSVLAGMSIDANCPDTFEEWCGEYGYDTDSRKAEAQYRLCKDHAYKLVRFFTSEELEGLQDIQ